MTDQAARTVARSRRSSRQTRAHFVPHLVLSLGGLLMMFPFVWEIIMSLSTNAEVQSITPSFWPAEIQWQNFAAVFDRLPFTAQFRTSIIITLIRVAAQVVLCTLAGYAFARMRFRGRGVLLGITLSILMVPPQAFLISQYQLVQQFGWLDSVAGIVAPGLFSAFGTFLTRTAFLGMPRELEEAGKLDGASPVRIFWNIMLPLARPTISVLVITSSLWSWNELLWPLVVSTHQESMPLSAGIATLVGNLNTDYPVLMAASILAIAPILILFVVLQRRVIDGLASSGLR